MNHTLMIKNCRSGTSNNCTVCIDFFNIVLQETAKYIFFSALFLRISHPNAEFTQNHWKKMK